MWKQKFCNESRKLFCKIKSIMKRIAIVAFKNYKVLDKKIHSSFLWTNLISPAKYFLDFCAIFTQQGTLSQHSGISNNNNVFVSHSIELQWIKLEWNSFNEHDNKWMSWRKKHTIYYENIIVIALFNVA